MPLGIGKASVVGAGVKAVHAMRTSIAMPPFTKPAPESEASLGLDEVSPGYRGQALRV